MSDLQPLPYPNVGRPFNVQSGDIHDSSSWHNVLNFAPTATYWHIDLIVFNFTFSLVDVINGAWIATIDQFGVPTGMVHLTQIVSTDPTTQEQSANWTNEAPFDTCAGFAVTMDSSGDSSCDLTVFGWSILWNPLVA
jgi:hypothetical protein